MGAVQRNRAEGRGSVRVGSGKAPPELRAQSPDGGRAVWREEKGVWTVRPVCWRSSRQETVSRREGWGVKGGEVQAQGEEGLQHMPRTPTFGEAVGQRHTVACGARPPSARSHVPALPLPHCQVLGSFRVFRASSVQGRQQRLPTGLS